MIDNQFPKGLVPGAEGRKKGECGFPEYNRTIAINDAFPGEESGVGAEAETGVYVVPANERGPGEDY